MHTNKKIHVLLLVDDLMTKAWVYRSVEQLRELGQVDICGILISACVEENQLSKTIYNKLRYLQSRLFNGDFEPPDYREIKSLTSMLNAPVFRLQPGIDDTEQVVQLSTICKNTDADVIIKYTDCVVSDAVPETALKALKYGVWDHLFNAGVTHRKGYEGFWETLLSEPEIGSSLRMYQHDGSDKVLIRSFSCTHEASIEETNNLNYWKSSSFAARALGKLIDYGEEAFLHHLASEGGQKQGLTAATDPGFPGNIRYAYLLAKKILFKLRKKILYKRLFEQWFLLYSLAPGADKDASSLIKMLPPKAVFWADPHVIYENERYYIFIEELPFVTNKGYLSVIEMDADGHYGEPVKILEKDYHLSYPYVFLHNGQYFMIPETYDNETIELYRCTRFPDQWEHVMDLMQGVKAVDTTLFYAENKWWMFTNIQENPGASPNDELFLFYTEGDFQTTEWTAHPKNPIVSDVKTARPAGKIYVENGRVYRPSQDCSHHYGYAINLNEITCLSTTDYQERTVRKIEPVWDRRVISTHTYSSAEQLTVLDGVILREQVKT